MSCCYFFFSDSNTSQNMTTDSKPKFYYKFHLLPKAKQFLKVHFDRLALLALLDR